MMARDTNVINTSVFYKAGEGLPDHGVAMVEQPYSVARDDFVLGTIIVLSFFIALVVYHGRYMMQYRIMEFFSTKRKFLEENMNANNAEVYSTFFLMSTCALSLALMVFDYVSARVGFERALGIPYWILAAGFVLFDLFFYGKAWLYALVNWTFFDKDANERWMQSYFFMTSLFSMPAFLLSMIVVVNERARGVVICFLVALLVIYELLLFFKLLVNFGGKSYGNVAIFLYFCSLEIVPAIALWRFIYWVTNNFIDKIL